MNSNYNLSKEELDDIKYCLSLSKRTFLGITALDSERERRVKEVQNETAIVRYINKCLKYFDK
jgi:hypothetical protein